eukprot:m.117589 g.117589  ORF g.117589 m.117589 type:complete len:309 (+) comp16402_c4_seq2:22-948(+)
MEDEWSSEENNEDEEDDVELVDFRTSFLTAYEQQSTPHEPVTDDTIVSLTPKALHAELMCPVCLSVLQQTMTTIECLHRFCAECISKSLRFGKKECPTCRAPCASKRSLRPDYNIDAIIRRVYPDRDAYEKQEAAVWAKIKDHHNQSALAQSVREGMRVQAEAKSRRPSRDGGAQASKRSRRSAPSAEPAKTASQAVNLRLKVDENVCLLLERDPSDKGLPVLVHKYLTVPRKCTTEHVVKFLWMRLKLQQTPAVPVSKLSKAFDQLPVRRRYSISHGNQVLEPMQPVGDLATSQKPGAVVKLVYQHG